MPSTSSPLKGNAECDSDEDTITEEEATKREQDCIVGDVNLFLNSQTKNIAEIEIMIAMSTARRKGFALEAVRLMMAYGLSFLKIDTFEAKIGVGNQPSINLFKNKLGFNEVSYSDAFKEVTLHFSVGDISEQIVIHDYFKIENLSDIICKYSSLRMKSALKSS